MAVQAFVAQPAVEALDEGVVGRLARPREIERDAVLIRPPVERLRDELRTVAHWEALVREPLWP